MSVINQYSASGKDSDCKFLGVFLLLFLLLFLNFCWLKVLSQLAQLFLLSNVSSTGNRGPWNPWPLSPGRAFPIGGIFTLYNQFWGRKFASAGADSSCLHYTIVGLQYMITEGKYIVHLFKELHFKLLSCYNASVFLLLEAVHVSQSETKKKKKGTIW